MENPFADASRLIVHGGSAHRDDLLTTCVLLSQNRTLVVERREPTAQELADPRVIVADIGMNYDTALHNYDHHQFPSDHPPCCALTLIFRALGREEMAREVWPWLRMTEIVDARGPSAAALQFGIPQEALRATYSPVEEAILRRFAASHRLVPGDALHMEVRNIGQTILEELEAINERLPLLESKARHITIGHITILDLRTIGSDPFLGVETFCRRAPCNPAVLITRNVRGPGYVLWRRNDYPGVDFRRLRGDPRVSFIHATGFMAVVAPDADPLTVATGACSQA